MTFFNPEKYIRSLKRGEVSLVEALVNSFDLGHSSEIELNEISVSVLIFTLRTVLEFLSAPLFTYTLSSVVEKKKFWGSDRYKNMAIVLNSIPTCFLDTLLFVVETLIIITRSNSNSIERMAALFANSFVRLHNKESVYGAKVVSYLVKHYNTLTKCLKTRKVTFVNDDDKSEVSDSPIGSDSESYEDDLQQKNSLFEKFFNSTAF